MLWKNDNWKLSVIRREANRIADGLASKAANFNWSWSSTSAVPIFLQDLIKFRVCSRVFGVFGRLIVNFYQKKKVTMNIQNISVISLLLLHYFDSYTN